MMCRGHTATLCRTWMVKLKLCSSLEMCAISIRAAQRRLGLTGLHGGWLSRQEQSTESIDRQTDRANNSTTPNTTHTSLFIHSFIHWSMFSIKCPECGTWICTIFKHLPANAVAVIMELLESACSRFYWSDFSRETARWLDLILLLQRRMPEAFFRICHWNGINAKKWNRWPSHRTTSIIVKSLAIRFCLMHFFYLLIGRIR